MRSIYAILGLSVTDFMFQILLMLGLAVGPAEETIKGTCHSPHSEVVPCRMQKHPYGTYFVTDEKVVYKFRRIWWGVYDVSIDNQPQRPSRCNVYRDDLICFNSITFISEK